MRPKHLLLLFFTLSLAKNFKRFKKVTIKDAKTKDELTFPKTLIECCGACVSSKSCKGVKFDGTTCTRLCDLTFMSTGIGNDEAYVDYTIIEGITLILIVILKSITLNLQGTQISNLMDQ